MNWIKSNLPNLLSVSRVALIIPFIIALAQGSLIWLVVLTVTIVLSDYFDGYLARRLNAVSDLGKILDPLADKICTAAVALALVRFRDFPLWLLAAMVVRDIAILLAGLAIMKARSIVPVSNIIGRLTMGVMTVCLVSYMLDIGFLKLFAAYLTMLMMILSLISYGRNNIRALGRKPA